MLRVFIYKRTHEGDPDEDGCFGCCDCMGTRRAWDFDAVIGIGGIGNEAKRNGIAGKVTWIGVGAEKTPSRRFRGPLVTFDHFIIFQCEDGPDLAEIAPALARRFYVKKARHVFDDFNTKEKDEIKSLLRLGEGEPPSPWRAKHRKTAKGRQC